MTSMSAAWAASDSSSRCNFELRWMGGTICNEEMFMGHSIDPVLIELSADATWVAEERVPLGPWQLRANQGYTGRANSVRTACAEPADAPWLKLITDAEAF